MIGANSLRTCGAQRGRQHEQDWGDAAHPCGRLLFLRALGKGRKQAHGEEMMCGANMLAHGVRAMKRRPRAV